MDCDLEPFVPIDAATFNAPITDFAIESFDEPALVIDGADGVIVRNVLIEHHGRGPAVVIRRSTGASLSNVIIRQRAAPNLDDPGQGILIEDSPRTTIRGAHVQGFAVGIAASRSDALTLASVNVDATAGLVGLHVEDSSALTVEESRFAGLTTSPQPTVGVRLLDVFDGDLRRTSVEGFGAGQGASVYVSMDLTQPEHSGQELTLEAIDVVSPGHVAFDLAPGRNVMLRATRVHSSRCDPPLWRADAESVDVAMTQSVHSARCETPLYMPLGVFRPVEADFVAPESLSVPSAPVVSVCNRSR